MTKNKWPLSIRRRRVCAALLSSGAFGASLALADDGAGPAPITVKVPIAAGIDRSGKYSGFRFEFIRTSRKGEATEHSRLSAKELPNGELQFHRRNDNGVAGSGVVANVKYTKQETPNEVVMTFEQTGASTYQEGLIFKKAIPLFSLKEVLLEGLLNIQFEVDSEFAVEAVKANFQRKAMLAGTPGGREMWRLTTPSGQQYVQLQFFPYRNGTKITASASVVARETSPGLIDFVQLVQEVQASVRALVQA